MKSEILISEIQNFCIKNADPQITLKYKKYFKEGFDSYGVTQEKTDEFLSSISTNENIDQDLINEISKELLITGKYEETTIPILLLIKQKKNFNKTTFNIISNWFDIGIENWAHTDFICSKLMDVLIKKEIIKIDDLFEWRISERKFKRRAVPVSLLALKKSEDISEILNFIEPMMQDKERVVHQGLGWLLRELWKKKPLQTEEFLLKWKDSSPRLIFQYACEKMEKDYKLKFKKEKS